jgi:hypothetical protein
MSTWSTSTVPCNNRCVLWVASGLSVDHDYRIALQSYSLDIAMTMTAALVLSITYDSYLGSTRCVAKKAGWLLNTNEECRWLNAPH